MILFFLIITFIANIGIMFYSVARKDSSRSVYFVLLSAALTVYTAGCMFIELSGTDDGVMTSLRIANLGIPFLAPCLLLIVVRLFQPASVKSWMLPAVGTYGLLTFLCIMFNNRHGLYYTDVRLVDIAGHLVHIEYGVLYWVQQGISLLLMIISYIILFRQFIKGNKKLRSHMILVIIGALMVFVANVMNFTHILPNETDPTPFVMTFVLILLTVAMAKYKLLDIGVTAVSKALKTMDDAIIIMDSDWCVLSFNDSAKSLFPSLDFHPHTEPVAKVRGWPPELEDAGILSKIVFERENESVDGAKSVFTYRADKNKIIDERGNHVGWNIIIRDVTGITSLVSQLENLATTDSLTGICNRRSFIEKVTRELDMSVSFRLNISNALLMYDIDDFKKINDTYGHAAGDHVLCSTVEIVKKRLRSYDIIARYGGEEFIIFMPATKEDALYKIAQSLCKMIENAKIVYNGTRIPVTASFGAVQIPPSEKGGAEIMKYYNDAMLAVDEAMYDAKHNGKNQAVVGIFKKSGE